MEGLMSLSPPGTGRVLPRNAPTYAIDVGPYREPLSPKASFLLAYERLALLARASAERTVVVVVVDPTGQVVAGRRVFGGTAVVLGRHEQCGVRLPADMIALRQLVALVQDEGGTMRIHLRDLATRLPFRTEDGSRSAAVVAEGPLYVAIGDYAIWFVPSELLLKGHGYGREAAWDALPPRDFIERRPPSDARGALPACRLVGADSVRVTHIAPARVLDDGDTPDVSWGVLKVEIGHKRETRWVSLERLEQGILLGRYSRCAVLVDASEAQTSRVHALLLLVQGDVWLVDLASTNGVMRDGSRLVAGILEDVDRFTLGSQVTIGWRRIHHADA
jgi:hypothetical protein